MVVEGRKGNVGTGVWSWVGLQGKESVVSQAAMTGLCRKHKDQLCVCTLSVRERTKETV